MFNIKLLKSKFSNRSFGVSSGQLTQSEAGVAGGAVGGAPGPRSCPLGCGATQTFGYSLGWPLLASPDPAFRSPPVALKCFVNY